MENNFRVRAVVGGIKLQNQLTKIYPISEGQARIKSHSLSEIRRPHDGEVGQPATHMSHRVA